MFSIPGKAPVTITPAAVRQITRLMARDNAQGLRIGVKKGGCAGMEYTMDYVSEAEPNDEVVEQDGARVLIAPMAQMFLFGTEIDYETSLLEFRLQVPQSQRHRVRAAAANRSSSRTSRSLRRSGSRPADVNSRDAEDTFT